MSSVTSVFLIAAGFLLYYALFLLYVMKGLSRLSKPSETSYQPFVSVVVATHNEQETVHRCLTSLLDQSYPAQLVELVIVDDHSSDRTAEIVQQLSSSEPRIRFFALPPKKDGAAGRKPEAIAKGVEHASGDVILTTDADCTVSKDWLRSMLRYFDPNTAFVAGPVIESGSTTFLGRLSEIEFLGLIGTAAGLIGNRTPIFCNGANLAFRKDAFEAAAGYGNHLSDCDDEILLQRIHSRRLGTITYSIDRDSIVTTHPSETIRQFLFQRMRWASKQDHYEGNGILLHLIILYFGFVAFLVLALATLFFHQLLTGLIGLFVLKGLVDFVVLRKASMLFNKRFPLLHFFIAELLHVPYIVVVAFLGQVIKPRWTEGRTGT